MICIGQWYGGPEWLGSPFQKFMAALGKALREETGKFHGGKDIAGPDLSPRPEGRVFEVGSAPAVNVIFYVGGSIAGQLTIPERIAAARYSRKQKWLLVDVPVPAEVAEAGEPIEFVADAPHQANAIAAEVFARKGPEPYDLEKADAIVDRVVRKLAARGSRHRAE